MKRELTQTRNEIEETTRKRVSDEVYADVRYSNPYGSNEFLRNSMMYESVDYDRVDDTQYLEMLPINEAMN